MSVRLLLFLSTSLTMLGCASLTPYSEVVDQLPPDNLVSIDGQKIHVEQSGDTSSEETPIVLLHGFAASTVAFRKITPQLSARRRVIALDLNGFGYTERPSNEEQYRIDVQCETILKVADAIGIDTFDLVGHSYGGALSMFLAAEFPERVQHLVLISPMAEFAPPPCYLRNPIGRAAGYGIVRALISSPKTFQKTMQGAYFQKDQFSLEDSESYRSRLLVEGIGDAYRGFGAVMSSGEEVRFPFEKIQSPTLVLAGRHDEIVPIEQSQRVASEIKDAELVILESSGHSSPEEQPTEVANRISEFLMTR